MSQRQTPSPNRAPIKLRTVSAKASTSNLTVTNVFAQPQLLHSGNGESIESPSASQENGDTSVVDNRKRSPSVSSNYDQRQDDRSPSPSKRIQIPRLGRASNKNSPVASFEERESRLARKSSLGWLKEIARKASKDSLNAVPRDLPLLTAEPMPIELTNEPADGLPVILSSSPKEETIAPELSTDLSSPPNVPEVQVQPSSPPVQSLDKIVSTPSASPLTPDPKSSSTTAPVAPSSSSSSWFKSVRKSSLPRPQATQPTTKTSSSPTRAFTISTTSSPARSSIPRFTPPSSPGTPTPSLPVTKKDSPAITHPSKGSPASPSPSDDLPPKRKVTLSLRRPSSPISNKKLVKSSIPAPISISGSSKTAEVVTSINSPFMEPLPPRRDMPTSATNNNLNVQASIDSILHNPNQVDHPPISSSSLSAPSSALPDNSQAQEPVTQIQHDSTPSENSSEQTPSIVTEPPVPSTPSKTTSAPPPAARTSSPALSIPKGWFSSIRPNSPKSPSVKGKEKEKDKSEEPNKSAESNVTSQPDVPALSSDGQPTSASPSVVTGSSSSPSATKVEEPVAAETPTAAVSTLTATSDMISTDAPAPIIDNPAPIPTPSQDNTIAEPVVPQVAVSPAPAQSSRGWFGLYKSGSSRPASIKGKAKEESIKENVQDESAGQGGQVPETKTVNEVKTQGDDTPQPSSSKEEPPVPPSTAHVGTEVVSEDASNRDPSTAKSEPEVVPIDQNVGSISSPNTPPVSRGWFGSYKVNPNSNSNVSLSKPAPPPTKLKEEVVVEVKNDNSAVENTPVEPQQPLEPVSPKPDINVSHPPIAITGNSKSEEPHVPRPSIASSPVYRGWFGSSTPTKSKQMSGVADENGKSRVTTETPKDVGPLMNEDTGPTASTTRPMETSSSQDTQVNSHQETSISGDAGSRLPVTTTSVSLPASNLNGTLPSTRYTLGLPLLGRRLKRGNVEKASTGAATEIESPMQRRDGEVDSIKGSIENLRDLPPTVGIEEDRNKGTRQPSALATIATTNGSNGDTDLTSIIPTPAAGPGSSEPAGHSVRPADSVGGADSPKSQSGPTSTYNSWWNYIGLGATVENTKVDNLTSLSDVEDAPAAVHPNSHSIIAGNGVKTDPLSAEDSQAVAQEPSAQVHTTVDQSGNGVSLETPVPQEHGEPSSPVLSGDPSSTWIGPLWSWMYATSAGPNGVTNNNQEQPAVPKTEAELVKEEALRRDSETQQEPELSQQEEQPSQVLLSSQNPVVTHAPSSSWLSFFSNRNMAAVKRVQDESTVGKDGMEVMDVDDLPPDTSSQGHPSTISNGSLVVVSTKPPVVNDSSPRSRKTSDDRGRSSRPGSLPGPRGSSAGDTKGPSVPLTTSDTIKRKASLANASSNLPKKGQSAPSTRTGSPAPSKPSSSAKERMPNFVLPTFGDSFFTMPRVIPPPSIVPVAPGSQRKPTLRDTLAKKTLSLVSGLLGAQATQKPAPPEDERPPTEEMLRYLEERSERLAKSWSQPSPPNSPTSGSTFSADSQSITPSGSSMTDPIRPRGSTSSSASIRSGKSGAFSIAAVGRLAAKGHYHLNSLPYSINAAKHIGRDLPRLWNTLGQDKFGSHGSPRKVVIIGIHGWFPGAVIRNLLGEPTGTSSKFASMMKEAVDAYMEQHQIELEKLTVITLEGEGTIARRVAKHYQDFLDKPEWVRDVHSADVIFIATHSQGSIVSTQLIASLVQDGHIRTELNHEAVLRATETSGVIPPPHPTRVVCLAQCGIHLGPLLYLNTSSLTTPYFTYFESPAAKELFEFQDTTSEASQKYVASLATALDHGVKFVYIASLDDQVVPIYSGVFMTASHPLILRALYVDGDAYNESDFLSNLIVFLLRIRNAGLDDSGLLNHLSEATAGSLSGVGHSTPYSNAGCYELAVRFLFETSGVLGSEKPVLRLEPFQARATRNDYEIPWALRGIFGDPAITSLFAVEMAQLRMAFDEWRPKTSLLKELRRKLEPIQSIRILPPSPLALHHTHEDEEEEHESSVVRTYSRL